MIIFKPHYWFEEQTPSGSVVIHISGRTVNSQTVYVLVDDFTPHVFLELPTKNTMGIKWNKSSCTQLFKILKNLMGDDGPIGLPILAKKKTLTFSDEIYTIQISLPSKAAAQKLAGKFKYKRYYKNYQIDGVQFQFEAEEFKVHEQNVDPMIKFTAVIDVLLAGWISVHPIESEEEDKYSTCDINLRANWKDISSAKEPNGGLYTVPKYCSFDIETYSKNHSSKNPDPEIPENVANQISMIFGFWGDSPNKRTHIILSLGKPRKVALVCEASGCNKSATFSIPNEKPKFCKIHKTKEMIHSASIVEVKRFDLERDMLLEFTKLIREYDPDIFVHYNGMKFDWDYLTKRAQFCEVYNKFAKLGRIIGKTSERRTTHWVSNAYGEQSFFYPECYGRTNVDVLLEVERNHKLPTYSLGVVAQHFLGDTKDDFNARALFMIWKMTNEILPLLEANKLTLSEYKSSIRAIFEKRKCLGLAKKYRFKLLRIDNIKDAENVVLCGMELMGKYCVQDANLTIDLGEKLNLWTTMEELSNVCNVPISYLHTRGQQIRVVAQVYRDNIKNNMIIPFIKRSETKIRFQGAKVIDAVSGYYEIVPTLDFNSLYPSIIIAFNISHDTFVRDFPFLDPPIFAPIPDSDCHIIQWEDHVGCEHDKLKRKKKKEEILCAKHYYRFLKVQISIDEQGNIVRKFEGVFPRIVRKLLAERKIVKKAMAKAEARVKMNAGTQTQEELEFYKRMGWPIIEKGSLSFQEAKNAEVEFNVLNAKQLALKVSANSSYGILGSQKGMIPLPSGAGSVTNMGREFIMMAINRIMKEYPYMKLVYGDTDSCMIQFEGKTLSESFELAKKSAKLVTHYIKCGILKLSESHTFNDGDLRLIDTAYKLDNFAKLSYEDKCLVKKYEECPVNLEFENMYVKYLLLTKKRYIAHVGNEEGAIISRTKKGMCEARRNYCLFVRQTSKLIVDGILEKLSELEVMHILYDRINLLYTMLHSSKNHIADIVLNTSIKSLITYADKKEFKEGEKLVEYYVDEYGNKIKEPMGPLDPRLVYKNLPQVVLAKKMMNRGDEIPANTRMEYLYIKNDDACCQGDKCEDYTYYCENKSTDNLEPDLTLYLEKQFCTPISELIYVKYPRQVIPYYSLEDRLRLAIIGVNDLHRTQILKVVQFIPSVRKRENKYLVGWDVLRDQNYDTSTYQKSIKKELNVLCPEANLSVAQYGTFKFQEAQATFIINEIDNENEENFNSMNLKAKGCANLYEVAKLYKSCTILNRLHKTHNLKPRKWHTPSVGCVGKQIRIGGQVILTKDIQLKKTLKECEDVIAKVVARNDVKSGGSITSSYTLFYEKSGETLVKVDRKDFVTFVTQDEAVIENIISYRLHYEAVVKEFKSL